MSSDTKDRIINMFNQLENEMNRELKEKKKKTCSTNSPVKKINK